jgi:hypothetical protein
MHFPLLDMEGMVKGKLHHVPPLEQDLLQGRQSQRKKVLHEASCWAIQPDSTPDCKVDAATGKQRPHAKPNGSPPCRDL